MAFQPTATSVVDYLKSKGQASDFGSRKKLYESMGLNSAMGDFRGTPEQNTTLLKKLQSSPQPGTTAPLSGSIDSRPASALSSVELATRAGVPESGLSSVGITPGTTQNPKPLQPTEVIDETTPKAVTSGTDLLLKAHNEQLAADRDAAGEQAKELSMDVAATSTRAAEELRRNVGSLTSAAQQGIFDLAEAGSKKKTEIGEKAAGFGGAFSGTTAKSQAEVAQEVLMKQDRVREKLGDELYSQFSDFEKNFGTEFLSRLSIPEAESFSKLPVAVRGIVMKNYQDALVKANEKASKGALDTLEKLGYTVIGGQIVQTLSGRAEERLQKGAEIREEKPLVKEYVVNGRRVRDLLDPVTGTVLSSTDLGDAGARGDGEKPTETDLDKTVKLLEQYKALGKTREDIEERLGDDISLNDEAALDKVFGPKSVPPKGQKADQWWDPFNWF